jgi:hypothetical protein
MNGPEQPRSRSDQHEQTSKASVPVLPLAERVGTCLAHHAAQPSVVPALMSPPRSSPVASVQPHSDQPPAIQGVRCGWSRSALWLRLPPRSGVDHDRGGPLVQIASSPMRARVANQRTAP